MRYCIVNLKTGNPASGLTNNLPSLKSRMDRIRAGGLYGDQFGIFSFRRKVGEFAGSKLDITVRKPYKARSRKHG